MPVNRSLRLVADDFGLDHETNEAILLAHHQGALTSAALMMGQSGSHEAITLTHTTPSLEIGLHLHFCDSIPLTCREWPWGSDPSSLGLRLGFQKGSMTLIENEIEAQWQAILFHKITPAFVNVHHHLHAHPWIARTLFKFLKTQKFKGWTRLGTPSFFTPSLQWKSILLHPCAALYRFTSPFDSPRTLWGIDRTFQMNAKEVDSLIRKIRRKTETLTDDFHEIIFHPRKIDDSETRSLIQLKNKL